MSPRSSEALFSMSAFTGLLALRSYMRQHPEVDAAEAVQAVKHVSADDAYHDYAAAMVLFEGSPEGREQDDIPSFLRCTLAWLIRRERPWWIRMFTFGRDRVRAALSSHELQCFEAAGLFGDTANAEVRLWWDSIQSEARSDADNARLLQGREAERLTFEHEKARLEGLGIAERPRWIALDDNTAGYDVHSFDVGPSEPVARLIEVKSCARDSREIFLSRNEWETATQMAQNYVFHLWLLPEQTLIEFTTSDLQRHVPQDRGSGSWQNVRITVSVSL